MRPGLLAAAIMLTTMLAVPAASAGTTTSEMCETIRRDIAEYHALRRPCPCPYSILRNGRMCGDLSAWAKPDGRAPRCYFSDVTGERPPNRRPNPIRRSWPDPPPCTPMS